MKVFVVLPNMPEGEGVLCFDAPPLGSSAQVKVFTKKHVGPRHSILTYVEAVCLLCQKHVQLPKSIELPFSMAIKREREETMVLGKTYCEGCAELLNRQDEEGE